MGHGSSHPPTLQRPEPSLLRAVSCPHGCVASHAHPIDFGTQGADRDLASSQCPLTLARVAFPLFPWTTGRGPAEGTGCVRVSSSFPSLLSERLVATSFVRLAWLFPPTCPKSPHLSLGPSPVLLSLLAFLSSPPPFEPRLAHLPAPTSCAIPVVCSGLGQGQTWQN